MDPQSVIPAMAAGRAVEGAEWCSSERTQLLSQAEGPSEQCSVLPLHSPHPPSSRRHSVRSVLHVCSSPSRLSSLLGSSVRSCRASVARHRCASASLLLVALLAAAVLLPCLVADPHARSQLLAVRLVALTKLVANIHAELAWRTNLLLLSWGSPLRACQTDTVEDAGPAAGLAGGQQRFSDVYLVDSEDGQSYDVSDAAPTVFSPSYRPSASSPYSPARVLACSTSSRRCDVAMAGLFQADLVAEMSSPTASSALCSAPSNGSSAACELWPLSHGGSERSGASDAEPASCGSGVLNMHESRHWWYYSHAMSCMRLSRSIGPKHGYCAGRDPHVDEQRVYFHLTMFGPAWRRQATLAVSSFLLTQNLSQSQLLIWTDRPWVELSDATDMQPILSAFASHVEVRLWSAYDELLASDSLLSTSAAWYASIDDSKGYLRGDLMRLLLLHNYGGVYYDADVLLLRDLAPMLGQQFLYKWGGHCDELNGAVVRMFKGSAVSSRLLDALYHTPPRPNSVDWGNNLYSIIHSSQLTAQPTAASLRSQHFTVFPACFFNPNLMEPGAFSPILRPELPKLWPGLWYGPFAYHLHGEVWNEKGFAARDPTYQRVAATITARMHATMRQGTSTR